MAAILNRKETGFFLLSLGVLFFIFQNFSTATSEATPVDPWMAPVGPLVQGVQLYDGWEDLRVLPAPVNVTGGWTDSAAISKSGKSLYFTYSQISGFQFITHQKMIEDGPTRPGMTALGMKNFRADLTPTGWAVNFLPEPLNDPDYNFSECSLSPNAAEDLIVFSKQTISPMGNTQIFYSMKYQNIWSKPERLPINSSCNDDNGFVIGSITTGVDLYFESDRLDEAGTACGTQRHLFQTHYDPAGGGSFSPVKKVPGLNGVGLHDSDTQPFVTQDKSRIYWTALREKPFLYGVVMANRQANGTYANMQPVAVPTATGPYAGKVVLLGEANIVDLPQGSLMYMICGIAQSDVNGKPDNTQFKICVARKSKTQGINTVGGWSSSPFISRDGQRLYFSYSRYNLAPWLKSKGAVMPVASGPDRPGLKKSATNPFQESDIYVSTRASNGKWTTPKNLGVNSSYADSSGMETAGGNTFVWMKSDGAKNNIAIANKNPDGTWGVPVDPGALVNLTTSGIKQDAPHLSADQKTLWFTSNRPGGQGGLDLWFSVNESINPTVPVWSKPHNPGSPGNTSGDEQSIWISQVTKDVYWTGPKGLMHCLSNGFNCTSSPRVVVIPGCQKPLRVSLPDDGTKMFFDCQNLTTFENKIMYSVKQSNGAWGPATAVD